MERKNVIEAAGRVVEQLRDGLFLVEMANGHRLRAHFVGKMKTEPIPLLPGDEVLLEISPYDLSSGRIMRNLPRLGQKEDF